MNKSLRLYITIKDDLMLNFNFFFKDKESKIYFKKQIEFEIKRKLNLYLHIYFIITAIFNLTLS